MVDEFKSTIVLKVELIQGMILLLEAGEQHTSLFDIGKSIRATARYK